MPSSGMLLVLPRLVRTGRGPRSHRVVVPRGPGAVEEQGRADRAGGRSRGRRYRSGSDARSGLDAAIRDRSRAPAAGSASGRSRLRSPGSVAATTACVPPAGIGIEKDRFTARPQTGYGNSGAEYRPISSRRLYCQLCICIDKSPWLPLYSARDSLARRGEFGVSDVLLAPSIHRLPGRHPRPSDQPVLPYLHGPSDLAVDRSPESSPGGPDASCVSSGVRLAHKTPQSAD